MLLFKRGSRDAFEELFARHQRRVVGFCYRMTGDHARAEEAAQETFFRIARAAFTYEPTARFSTWMFQIARRTTLNFLRDQKEPADKVPIPVGEENDDGSPAVRLAGPDSANPEQAAWGAELQGRFLDALQGLPESHRTAFVLAAGEGMSYQEIAAVMGVTVQAVKSRIFRSRALLLDRLSGILD